MRGKVLVIGLDGLTLQLLQPLVASGQLPTFAKLLQQGAYGVLRSVTNMTTGPTWASFATGHLPQGHGIWHDFHHQPHHYQLQPTQGRHLRQPTFWQIASEAGRQVIVLNVPMTYPAIPVRGALIAGIDTPSEWAAHFDYPAGSYQTLRRQKIDYLIDCGLASYMQANQVQAGVEAVKRETEGRTRAAEYLMRQMAWDLCVVVYSLPDIWQHYYWTAAAGSVERERMYDGYRLLDQHLARLLHELPTEGTVILCSDHGFAPLLGTRAELNQWLAQQNFLRSPPVGRISASARLLQWGLAFTRQRFSFRRRQQLLASVPFLRPLIETRLRLNGIDWSQTQAYAALDHLEIWLNVRGRQPQGVVAEEDYEAVSQRLVQALLAWRDPVSGQPYLLSVQRNPYPTVLDVVGLPPDLALEWNPAIPPRPLHPLITGDHSPEGTFIIAGQHIRSQALPPLSLVDIAPIALHALGLTPPVGLAGAVPPQLQ